MRIRDFSIFTALRSLRISRPSPFRQPGDGLIAPGSSPAPAHLSQSGTENDTSGSR